MNKIIAIVGMCGSGKSEACKILEELGWKSIYFGGVVIDKLKEASLDITPENEKNMREKLRSEMGMGVMAKLLLPKILETAKENNTVLDGLYSWDEYKILKEELGDSLKVIAIIVDRNIRYQRLSTRNIRPLTPLQAENRDIAEIENLAKGGPIAMADYYIDNNSNFDNYRSRLLNILEEI
jgi:dephospho-CoA kinase